MTPELQALYRQVAQALDARGVEHGLLGDCRLCCGKGAHTGLINPETRNWTTCEECQGIGTIVPSEAECFYRLFKVAGSRHYELDWRGRWTVDDDEDTGSNNPLDALLRAAAQSLGLEAPA